MARLRGISTAAREVGCAEATLRALEARGVLNPERDSTGKRLFDDVQIELARRHLASRQGARTA